MADKPSADELLNGALLAMLRDAAGRYWPRAIEFEFELGTPNATEKHLEQCPDAEVTGVTSATKATDTGTQIGVVQCTVRCAHGYSAAARAGAYGHVSGLIDRMEQYGRDLVEDTDTDTETDHG